MAVAGSSSVDSGIEEFVLATEASVVGPVGNKYLAVHMDATVGIVGKAFDPVHLSVVEGILG